MRVNLLSTGLETTDPAAPGKKENMQRKLKIEEKGTHPQPTRRVPYVRLKGRWLAAAGFIAGGMKIKDLDHAA